MTNVKWLMQIEVLDAPFDGYQQEHAYRLRQTEEESGDPLSRMLPRALMVPPGYPDFHTRMRMVQPGPCTIDGRAWSGWGEIVSVEVSADGGESWEEATLDPAESSRWAWRGWSYEWTPQAPGEYTLCCRARDEAGKEQPLEPAWNVGGYANNVVQRVPVTVLG
jgi:hypothetical protein